MTEETRIEPALTPEEWKRNDATGEELVVRSKTVKGPGAYTIQQAYLSEYEGEEAEVGISTDRHTGRSISDPRVRHALAAFALHGQPFGFTWEIVDVLREIGQHNVDDGFYGCDPEAGRKILEHADKVAALLPPREETE